MRKLLLTTLLIMSSLSIFAQNNIESIALNPDEVSLGITFTSVGRGILGMLFLIGICYSLSSNRKKINWRLVLTGLGLQLLFAVLVLKVSFVAVGFDWISTKVVEFLNIAEEGALFVFGKLVDPSASMGYIFAFKVLPTIVFFSACLLYTSPSPRD